MRDRYDIDIAKLREGNILGRNMALLRKHKGMSQIALSRELGLMGVRLTAGALSRWEHGDAVPNAYQLLVWCRIFGVSDIPETLFGISGLGGKEPLLNTRGQELLYEIREALIASGRYAEAGEGTSQYEPAVTLRVYSQSVAAGTGNFLDDEDFEEVDFPKASVPDGTDFAVRISGDSMEPRYADGDIAMVQRALELSDGDIGIFTYNGDAFIKEYLEVQPSETEAHDYTDSQGVLHKRKVLHSLNVAYRDIEIPPGADFAIIGRVLN